MEFKNDMTMMLAVHGALRRELIRIGRVAELPGDDPANVLRAAEGWAMFKSFLHVHHGAEDDVLWPAIRASLDSSEGIALLDAMEAEHAQIDPAIEAVDQATADAESGTEQLAECVDTLSRLLLNHIDHEEHEGLALIDATVTEQAWATFSAERAKRLGPQVSRFFPWAFDGAQPAAVKLAISHLPSTAQQAFHADWEAAYAQLTTWPHTAINPWGGQSSRD